MNQHSNLTQQQLERLSHHSEEVRTSLLLMAFQSFSRSTASPDHRVDIKQPSGMRDADVTAFVRALTELIAQSVRQNLTGDQFIETLQSLKIEINRELAVRMFGETKASLHPVISLMSCRNSAIPKFRDMEWRIEMEVHRKNLRNVYTPVVLMNFSCDAKESGSSGSSGRSSGFVRMRVADVHHVREVLEEALIEANSHKIERQVRKWI